MKARRPKKMFPLILNFRWRKFILTYDFSDFGLVFVVNLPHLFRFVKKKKKRLNTNSVISRVGYTVRNIFGEGDGTLLQFSCLENPMDGGA